jgi:hypothetical protein
LIGDNAVASLSDNTVINNGLTPGSEPSGGVIVWENGKADLGGGSLVVNGQTVSSEGRNRLTGNGTADVRNMRSGYTVKAEDNCWDHPQAATILAEDILGTVDVDPPTTCGQTRPPTAPFSLRIVF